MFGIPFLSFLPYVAMAGAAVSAIGAYRQGKAAKAAAEYSATINEQNAQIAREQARQQIQQHDREQYLRLGKIRATQGKAGGTAEGSVLDILADTAAQGEIERQDIAYRGELSARGYTNAAAVDRFEGSTARSQSYLRAGSELLSGGVTAGTIFQRGR
jgi:hypothetical protein